MKPKAFIVDDESIARDTLNDFLSDRFEISAFANLDDLHEKLLEDVRPDAAFVDLQLRADATAGYRALELLRGFSPTTVVYVVSVDAARPLVAERLQRCPFVHRLIQKGGITDLLRALDESPAPSAVISGLPIRPGRISVSSENRQTAHDRGIDINAVVTAAFPLDEQVDVMVVNSGMSQAVAIGVVVRSSVWRAQNAFFLLKAGGPNSREELSRELDNYRKLRKILEPSTSTPLPKCYGLIHHQDLTVLIFEYLGVAPQNPLDQWEPTHLDKIFGKLIDVNGDHKNQRPYWLTAFNPVVSLIRSRAGSQGRWLTNDHNQEVKRLCHKAAAQAVRRLGRTGKEEDEIELLLSERYIGLEEGALVKSEGSEKILNPIYRLEKLEIEEQTLALNLGMIHGDLHCKNLILANVFPKGYAKWALIDFGNVKPDYLQMLDAARLECDLLFEKSPLLDLKCSYDLFLHSVFDAASLTAKRRTLSLEAGAVARVLEELHNRIALAFDERWEGSNTTSYPRQYLYALLYESVRWLTHSAGPLRFLQRLFYGSAVCEALDEVTVHEQRGRG